MCALVKDIMTKDVATVSEDATIKEALEVLRDKKVSSLLVKPTGTRPFGIVTRWDFINALVLGRRLKEARVYSIMTAPLILATPNLRVEDAAALMSKYGVRRLPVLKKGEIVGILSNSDILRYVTETD